MGNSIAITRGGWILRFVSRRIPACAALVAHIAVFFTLIYDPTARLVISEQPGPTLVEIVAVSPQGSTAVEGGEAAEPTSTAMMDLPPQTLVEEPSREISEQGETIEKPVTLPTPRPKRAAVARASALPVLLAPSFAPPRERGATGVPDQPTSELTGTSDTAQAPADVPAAWKARLLSHLERYKRYPSEARMKGTEGTALLSFGMDRDGQVLRYHLVRSSGSPELDDEAVAMIVRASPLPPVPPEITTQAVQLVVPVRFRM
ncbi:energy transducer TonB [Nitrobacter sp.]|uniref:energy transducer TonB n=1 Tax=Nitrobacter sp. TaxID=29420 RepID=UPI001DD66B54|nr:energy transducer TonB [Nitrobacter sp.]MCB1393761.1 energy transducer TonB [Nitrobacter sp.]